MAWWLWLLLGLVLAALELASTGGFYLIFFGVSAMFIGLMAAIGLGGPLWLQWLVFTILSVVLLLVFRRPDPPDDERRHRAGRSHWSASSQSCWIRFYPALSAAPNCAAARGPRAIFTAPSWRAGSGVASSGSTG